MDRRKPHSSEVRDAGNYPETPWTAYTGAYTKIRPAGLVIGPRRRNDAGVTYYAERAARDPEWRRRAIAAAGERQRRAKAADPEGVREPSRRYRQRLRETSLTFTDLLARSPIDDPHLLRLVLADELRRGTVERVQRRYRLNGALPCPTT